MAKIEDISIKKQVYEYIRDMILTLQIKPGEKIPESSIAATLGISKGPVREAIRLLSWEGLIEITPNRSATVTVIDENAVQELALVRWQHDELAIPLAIYNGSIREFAELRELAEACIAANEAGDILRRHALDAQFHLKIIEIGKNKLLYSLYNRIILMIQLWQTLHVTSPDNLKEGLEQHLRIVDCLENHQTEEALHMVHNHTKISYNVHFDEELQKQLNIVWQTKEAYDDRASEKFI